jgi:hypothetical protein
LADDERELSVKDFLPRPSRWGGGVKQAARCEQHCDWRDEQCGGPSRATEEHAAKRIANPVSASGSALSVHLPFVEQFIGLTT